MAHAGKVSARFNRLITLVYDLRLKKYVDCYIETSKYNLNN